MPAATRPKVQSWQTMRERMAQLLLKRTGSDVGEWTMRIARQKVPDEAALRHWLQMQGVTGYSQTLLVWERFGYPSFMKAQASDLIDPQYQDRPQLRPILDAVLPARPQIGSTITVQARKSYVCLVSERRTFAVVQATTRNRVDLGLRLSGTKPAGRLRSGKGVGNGSMTVKLELTSADQLDALAIDWLKRAHRQNQ